MALYHEVAGEGETVVLLHAGLGDSRMWDRQRHAFAARYRTVRCDMRGWGRSPIGPGSFSNAGDVLELCEELEVDRAAFVGISMGGNAALEVAVARPGLVSALVLAGTGLPGHEWSGAVRAFQREEGMRSAVATSTPPSTRTSARGSPVPAGTWRTSIRLSGAS
jgi:pimeloyl-ACP methyl ester carboxylesterase